MSGTPVDTRRFSLERTTERKGLPLLGWFLASHPWARLVSLLLGCLTVWLINRELQRPLVPDRSNPLQVIVRREGEVEKNLFPPGSVPDPASEQRAIIIFVPRGYAVLDATRRARVQVRARSQEGGDGILPLTATIPVERLAALQGQETLDVSLEANDIRVAHLDRARASIEDAITISLSRQVTEQRRLVVYRPATDAEGPKALPGLRIEPDTLEVAAAVSDLEEQPGSGARELPIVLGQAAWERISESGGSIRLDGPEFRQLLDRSLADLRSFEIMTPTQGGARIEYTGPVASLDLNGVTVVFTEVTVRQDVELRSPSPPITVDVRITGTREVIERLRTPKEKARLLKSLRMVAYTDPAMTLVNTAITEAWLQVRVTNMFPIPGRFWEEGLQVQAKQPSVYIDVRKRP